MENSLTSLTIRISRDNYEKLFTMINKKRFAKISQGEYEDVSFDDIITELLTNNSENN